MHLIGMGWASHERMCGVCMIRLLREHDLFASGARSYRAVHRHPSLGFAAQWVIGSSVRWLLQVRFRASCICLARTFLNDASSTVLVLVLVLGLGLDFGRGPQRPSQ